MTLVDTSDDILQKAIKGIEGSLKRVVKKKFADKPEVRHGRTHKCNKKILKKLKSSADDGMKCATLTGAFFLVVSGG